MFPGQGEGPQVGHWQPQPRHRWPQALPGSPSTPEAGERACLVPNSPGQGPSVAGLLLPLEGQAVRDGQDLLRKSETKS